MQPVPGTLEEQIGAYGLERVLDATARLADLLDRKWMKYGPPEERERLRKVYESRMVGFDYEI